MEILVRFDGVRRVPRAALTMVLGVACADATTAAIRPEWSRTPSLAIAFDPSAELIPTGLGTLGGAFSGATAVNSHGQVVGGALDSDGALRDFIWTAADGMRILGFEALSGALPV